MAAAETGSLSPAQAFKLTARPFGSTVRSSRAAASRIWPRSRLGGRPALSLQRDTRVAAGPSGSRTAKRRSRSAAASALRRRSFAEAAALCSARRARSTPAAGGSRRRCASKRARLAPAANRRPSCPALPFARAQLGTAGGGKACVSVAFAEVRLVPAPRRRGAGTPSPGSTAGSGTRVRSARITWAW